MFNCLIIGRLIFFSLTSFKISPKLVMDYRNDHIYPSSLSLMMLEHLSSTQNNFIFSKKFLTKSLDPESFKCGPFRLRCLLLMFLLLITSILRLINDSLTETLSKWFFRYQFLVWGLINKLYIEVAFR